MLMNLLMPIMHNYLSVPPKPYMRLHTLVSGLVIIGAFWISVAVYLFYVMDYYKAVGALISGVICLFMALITSMIAYYTRKKVADSAFDVALKEIGPAVGEMYSLLNSNKVKMALPLAALVAGYLMVKRR
jgi:hypothetical protein